jgi:DNA polymerase I-like protein with 3'-5' exonuclease and polymerase domains
MSDIHTPLEILRSLRTFIRLSEMLITIDFETYYDKKFSLSKLTTEEYIRDKRFEVIGVALKVNEEDTQWFSGTKEETKEWLSQFDWNNAVVLAHNTMFDGAILSWYFDIHPYKLLDTLCMARAVNGVFESASLANLAKKYNLGEKGLEVHEALGKRRLDFTLSELEQYAQYCRNDVQLTYDLFTHLHTGFPTKELKIIDITLKMFTEPGLRLNVELLTSHLQETSKKKLSLLTKANVSKEDLMSNDKFAARLGEYIEPPTKISARTGKKAWAFAKTDEEFKELAEHENENVRDLVTARLANKTTLEETRTQRFIDIANRGMMPVPLRYYAAHTGRWGGDDKINLQNLPSRGEHANKLKKAMIPLEGYTIIDADSSQIEARILAWLAEQDDLVESFKNGEDVYKIMAKSIYGKPVEEITKEERFVGKTTILGCGYGMGAVRFRDQLKTFGVDISQEECKYIVDVYRSKYSKISELWRQADRCLQSILDKTGNTLGKEGALLFDPIEEGFQLPNKLWQRYRGLFITTDEKGLAQYSYKARDTTTSIYGGKLIENVCQALARCVVAQQMAKISNKYKVVLTVHDAVACIVKEEEVDEGLAYVEECMKWRPSWCKDLPLDCELGSGKSYGDT